MTRLRTLALVAITVLLTACGQAARMESSSVGPSPSEPTASVTALPSDTSPSSAPSASEPGGSIAIAGPADGEWHIRVVESGSGIERWNLELPGMVLALRWSPDGRWLAIVQSDGPLLVVSANGEDRVQLPDSHAASWSPDSGTLAVQRQTGIHLVNLETRDEERVGPPWWVAGAELSPDGRSILFLSDERPSGTPIVGEPMVRLYRLDLPSGSVTPLTPPGYYSSPGWSPDGSRIAILVGDGFTWFTEAQLLDSETGAATPLGTAGWEASPWSPDGSRLLLDDGKHLWTAKADGTMVDELSVASDGMVVSGYGWSADGKWVLVNTAPESGTAPGSIRAVHAQGQEVELGAGDAAAWQPIGE